MEARPDLAHLAIEFKRRIDLIRQQILALQGNKETSET
jgi:hypothetical protein